MAYNSNPGKQSFIASAGQTEFNFNFKLFSNTDILVYQTSSGQSPDDAADILMLTTDYTVTITGDLGGMVTLNVGAGLNDTLVLYRALPQARSIEYQTSGDLLATTLNDDQDDQTYLIVDQTLTNSQSIRLPNASIGVSTQLPNVVPDAFLGWNSGGTAIINNTTILDSVQEAAASAAAALASETAAGISETNAGTSETNAASSETNAGVSAVSAGVSETNAGTSETNSASSEAAAGISETNAGTSETNAAASETAAGISETNAASSETNAGISAINAGVSETNAGISETNSAASAVSAADSAAGIGDLDSLSDVTISTPINNEVLTYNSGSGEWENQVGGGTSEFTDSTFRVTNGTKKIAFSASTITASTTRTYTLPDEDGTIALSANVVDITTAQSIAGVKTFTSSPIVPAPTTDLQAATKKYVDDNVSDTWVANDSRAKTALNVTGSAPIYAVRTWANFNGTGTVSIRNSGNVSSITDNGVGRYQINYTVALPSSNYSINANTGDVTDGTAYAFCSIFALGTTSARIRVTNATPNLVDRDLVTFSIVR